MPDAHPISLLLFSSASPPVWSAAWFPNGPGAGVLALDDAQAPRLLGATLEAPADGAWAVRADGVELRFEPDGDPVAAPPVEGSALEGEQRRGQVHMTGAADATGPGLAGRYALPDPPERADSIRAVGAWFDAAEMVGVVSVRPRKHRGHGQDAIAGAVDDPDGSPPVSDPRLSTTYAADGHPARMNLELWTGDETQLARRVAGETTGRRVAASAAGWQLDAQLLECHSRGREGSGVYLLARPV
jgi:hypothetical protein